MLIVVQRRRGHIRRLIALLLVSLTTILLLSKESYAQSLPIDNENPSGVASRSTDSAPELGVIAMDPLGERAQLWESLAKAFELWTTWGVVIVMVVVFGFGLRKGWWRLKSARKALKSFRPPPPPAASESVADFRNKLHDAVNGAAQTQQAVDRYTTTITFRDSRFFVPVRLSSVVSIDDFVNESGAVLAARIPTILTTLGLLGTFLGIALALGDIASSGGNVQDNIHIVNKIKQTVPGLAAAFWTSIIGIVLALTHSTVANWQENKLRKEFVDAIRIVDDAVQLWPPTQDSLAKIVDTSSKQLTFLDQSVKALTGILRGTDESEGLLKSILADFTEKLTTGISNSVVNNIKPGLDQLNTTLEQRLNEISGDTAEAARTFAADAAQNIGHQFSQVVSSLGQSIQDFGSQFANLAQKIEAMDSLLQRNVEAQADSSNQTEAVLSQARLQVEASAGAVVRLKDVIERLDDAMKTSELVRSETGALVKQQAEHQTKMSEFNEQTLARLEKASEHYARFADRLEETTTRIAHETQSFSGKVQMASIAAETAGRSLDQATAHLTQRIDVEETLLTQYGAGVRDLERALNTTRSTLTTLDNTTLTLNQSANSLDRLGETLRLVPQELQKSSEQLTTQLKTATASLKEVGVSLERFTKETNNWADVATRTVEKFGSDMSGSVKDTLSVYDKTLTDAVSVLKTSINELSDALEELPGKVGLSQSKKP